MGIRVSGDEASILSHLASLTPAELQRDRAALKPLVGRLGPAAAKVGQAILLCIQSGRRDCADFLVALQADDEEDRGVCEAALAFFAPA